MNFLIPLYLCLAVFIKPAEENKKMKLIWSDEFNINGAPDSTNWNYDLGNGEDGWGNQESEFYTRQSENVKVENGSLIINATKKNGQWTSARIKTQSKKNFTYGKIVFRAKLPVGKGTWPALWMLSENIKTVGWPACGEIDIMEHVGRNPGVVQSAMHTQAMHGETLNKGSVNVSTFNTEFHNYEALWLKDKIEFSVDGKVYYTFIPKNNSIEEWPFNSPCFIIINMAMGGGLGGAIDPSLAQAKLEVDYVRVYTLSKK
jgi:beta-glucanase (GH16 family)